MRRSIGLPLILETIILLAVVAFRPAVAAQAATCGERIAKLETDLRQAEADRRVLSARESTAATMHRQPTPETIARSETDVEEHLASRLEAARKLNAEGRESDCLAALGRFAVDR